MISRKLTQSFTAILLVMASLTSMAQTNFKMNTKDFPKAEKGFKQVVIDVPYSDQDNLKKIEFYVGKMMDTDDCNSFNLSGEFEKQDLAGFGYTYYTFKSNGQVMSTMIGCMSGITIQQFVKSQSVMERYNGRMPIVVYVPEEFELRFKIWKVAEETYFGAEVQNDRN